MANAKPKLPARNDFEKIVKKDSFVVNLPLPSRDNKVMSTHIRCTYDKYDKLLEYLDNTPENKPISVKLYDERRSIKNLDLAFIIETIRLLNTKNINELELFLSDDTFPIYSLMMHKYGWSHEDSTRFHLSIDRHPIDQKRLNLVYTPGKLCLPEEKLIWVPQHILRNLNGKIDSRVLQETKKLKTFINQFNLSVRKAYEFEELTDINKTLLVYNYIRNNITFAMDRTFVPETTHIRTTVKDPNNWQSRPYGTLEHKRGVCEGQARLMVSMLNNPSMRVDAVTINGEIPSGERHTWVGIHTNNRLYECCTTLSGPFKNLQRRGYQIDDTEQYPKIYKRSYLTDKEFSEECADLIRKRKR